jgi:hypothetical protein
MLSSSAVGLWSADELLVSAVTKLDRCNSAMMLAVAMQIFDLRIFLVLVLRAFHQV